MKNGLHQLFLNELADIYSAEQQLVKALPKMAENAGSAELRSAFESHLRETENHVVRLERAFESLAESPSSHKCKAMKGLIAEGKEILGDYEGTECVDAALIAAAQKIEHYEIATYGCLCTWAELMGHAQALQLLRENLTEEKAADEKLTAIAKSRANMEAQAEAA
jgi:ferritin-like metal-binding protein YciE